MSLSNFGFLADDNLPSRDHIVAMCREAGECRGIPLPNQPGEPIVAWVKYGPGVTTDEALTQDRVAKALNAKLDGTVQVPRVYDAFSIITTTWPIGFIVMEYIDALDCTRKEIKLVAHAVQMLIGVPRSKLYARTRWRRYETVDEPEQYVNGILNIKHDTRRKRPDGKVVALDFRATCFLSPSFFAVAMKKAEDIFTQNVAQRVDYPKSDHVAALVFIWFPAEETTSELPEASAGAGHSSALSSSVSTLAIHLLVADFLVRLLSLISHLYCCILTIA